MIDLFHAQPETPEPAPLPVTGQIADALLAGKPRLRLILDSLHIGIVIIDAETHEILTANPRALALLGAPADAVLGRVCHQFICPAEHGKCPITDLGLAVEQSERVLIDADNTRLPIIKSVARISLDGRPCLVESFIDITEQKKTEQTLRESQEQIQYLIEHTADCVFQIDPAGRFLQGNSAVEQLTGYPRAALLQMQLTDLVAPAYHAMLVDRVQMRLDGGCDSRPYELELVHRDGHHVWVELSTTGLTGADGQLVSLLGIGRDITERMRAAEERLEIERRLLHSQKLESLGVLAGGIAHDFNNLLTAIIGNLDIALLHLAPGAPARLDIAQAMQASHRAADLTRQMLAYSGKGRFLLEEIDVQALVRENIDIFRAAIARTVTLTLATADAVPAIVADPGQVQQVVMNLLTNASEAIGNKPGVITLATGVQTCEAADLAQSRLAEKPAAGRFVFLEVADTGNGMDADTQARLFDPFFTTKFTGRGLGMSVVQGIVQGHHGAILVRSAPRDGTTIRVLFPIGAAVVLPVGAPAPPAAAAPVVPAGAKTILVVDDDASVRQPCVGICTNLGFDVLEAANGEEAVALCHARHDTLGCVLLDLTMPCMDGVETFHILRRAWPSLPIILYSGYSEMEMHERFTTEQPNAFLQKPFRIDELRAVLAQVLPG